MSAVNKVILIGNLGNDPEVRTFQDGGKVVNLSIATSETWKDRDTGEKRERTEWHRVAIFGPLADIAERYLRKGSKVYVEGKLATRKWQDQSGQDRYTTEIVLRGYGASLVLLDGRDNSDQRQRAPGVGDSYNTSADPQAPPAGGGTYDDEIPF